VLGELTEGERGDEGFARALWGTSLLLCGCEKSERRYVGRGYGGKHSLTLDVKAASVTS